MAQALRNARNRSKKRGWDFNITIEDLAIPDVCPVLGLKLEVGRGKLLPNSPSIDRINNNKGYVKGNVRVISLRANSLKTNMTLEEARLVLKDLETINV